MYMFHTFIIAIIILVIRSNRQVYIEQFMKFLRNDYLFSHIHYIHFSAILYVLHVDSLFCIM